MTKDLINHLRIHRNVSITKAFTKEFFKTNQVLTNNNSKYLFHKSYYLDLKTPIKVLCRSHGFFYKSPKELLKGIGCEACKAVKTAKLNYTYKDVKYTKKSFLEAVNTLNSHKFDYSQTVFNGFNKLILVCCHTHRYIRMKPHLHLSSKVICPKCRGAIRNH